jgi:hypothetical protein
MSNVPDFLTHMGGVPVGGARFSSPWATHWFVDATDGAAGNSGKRPDDALNTIQAAITAAAGGDVIYIRPQVYTLGTGFARYTEDITIAQASTTGTGTETNANKSIIGVTQRQYPSDMLGVRTKYATAGHGGWNIEAPGTHIEGIGHFAEDATSYAMFFESNGGTRTKGFDGSSMYNVMVKGKGVDLGSATGGSGDMSIVNCKFQCKYDGTGTPLIKLTGSAGAINRLSIINCDFIGGNANNYATAVITGAAPVTSFVMRNCHFSQDPDSGDFINFAGTSNSGVITNCYFGSESLAAKMATLTSGSSGIHVAGLFDENGAVDFS